MIRLSMKLCLQLLVISALALPCWSQKYEVRAIGDEFGYIAVQLRDTVSAGLPTTTSDFTDFQFEIRWPSAYGEEVDLQLICSDYHVIDGLNSRESNGGYYWRVFAADSIPFHPPENWVLKQWETIGKFKVNYPWEPDTGYFAVANQDWVIQGLNLSLEGVDYAPIIKDSATNYIFPTTVWGYVWKGGATPWGGFDEHSWTYGLNWENECGQVYDTLYQPYSSSRCIIPGGRTYYPTNLNNYFSGYCRDLKMNSGSYLEIPEGKTLNISGNVYVDPSAEIKILNGGTVNIEQPD